MQFPDPTLPAASRARGTPTTGPLSALPSSSSSTSAGSSSITTWVPCYERTPFYSNSYPPQSQHQQQQLRQQQAPVFGIGVHNARSTPFWQPPFTRSLLGGNVPQPVCLNYPLPQGAHQFASQQFGQTASPVMMNRTLFTQARAVPVVQQIAPHSRLTQPKPSPKVAVSAASPSLPQLYLLRQPSGEATACIKVGSLYIPCEVVPQHGGNHQDATSRIRIASNIIHPTAALGQVPTWPLTQAAIARQNQAMVTTTSLHFQAPPLDVLRTSWEFSSSISSASTRAGSSELASHSAPVTPSNAAVTSREKEAETDVSGAVILPRNLPNLGAKCAHMAFWKRLRSKKGFAYYVCRYCDSKWRIPTISLTSSGTSMEPENAEASLAPQCNDAATSPRHPPPTIEGMPQKCPKYKYIPTTSVYTAQSSSSSTSSSGVVSAFDLTDEMLRFCLGDAAEPPPPAAIERPPTSGNVEIMKDEGEGYTEGEEVGLGLPASTSVYSTNSLFAISEALTPLTPFTVGRGLEYGRYAGSTTTSTTSTSELAAFDPAFLPFCAPSAPAPNKRNSVVTHR